MTRALGFALLGLAAASLGCGERSSSVAPSSSTPGAGIPASPAVHVERAVVQVTREQLVGERLPSDTPHPRLLLDADTRARLRQAAQAETPTWRAVRDECRMYMDKDLSGGYRAFQWTEAIASLSLCWYATDEDAYARRAVFYLRALLDDKDGLGDGKGGDEVVRADNGYPIRTHAVYAALAYDWLHDAPDMTPELRARIIQRLRAWIPWYRQHGYLNDNPFANYFWGWHTAITFAALATYGDNPEAPEWLTFAREQLLGELVIPGFSTKLRGGEWAEGWQYGQLVATQAAWIVRAYETATGARYGPLMPWLKEVVDHQLHSLMPHRGAVYDNGTRHEKPPPPTPQALTGLLVALDHLDPDKAAEARFIAGRLYPEHPRRRVWVKLLTEREGAPLRDPRPHAGLSYHMPGPGLTFARSSWRDDAIWTSFQAGPRIADDHQHNDHGHFALWRGGDALLVDGGGPFGYASINHNTLLIDDDKEALNYTPNQGVWNKEGRTTHYGDDGVAVVAVGDLTDAWRPKCANYGCNKRAVREAIRTFVYVRPNLLVVRDRVEVGKPGYGVRWAVHVPEAPRAAGNLVSGVVGGSRVDIRVLEGGKVEVHKEPTAESTHIWEKNEPNGDMWRVDVHSPLGDRRRRFLHWITAQQASARPPEATLVHGEGLSGARGETGDGTVAVLFAERTAGGSVELPARGDDLVVVVGLEPEARYRAIAQRQGSACRIRIDRVSAAGLRATTGGSLSFGAKRCEVR